jgi:hypothetical protein
MALLPIAEIRRQNLKALAARYRTRKLFADALGVSEAQLSQWINGSKDSKTGRQRGMADDSCRLVEDKLVLERGWMDRQHSNEGQQNPEVAHIASQLRPTIKPTTMQWELILVTEELPTEFTLPVRDDAMAPRLVRGGLAHCSTAAKHGPRDLVLIADNEGGLYIREYAEITATHWQAVAAQPGYLPLDSKSHGLRVLAKVVGAWWG